MQVEPSVVLVESDYRLAELYKSAIEASDDSLKVVNQIDAQGALHAIDAASTQLIILEIDLPDHNGFEFLYEFASYDDWRRIPIVVLSRLKKSYFSQMLVAWEELGVVDYLYKAETTLYDLQNVVSMHREKSLVLPS
jgi:DNA-binding response OmpR family regulator